MVIVTVDLTRVTRRPPYYRQPRCRLTEIILILNLDHYSYQRRLLLRLALTALLLQGTLRLMHLTTNTLWGVHHLSSG